MTRRPRPPDLRPRSFAASVLAVLLLASLALPAASGPAAAATAPAAPTVSGPGAQPDPAGRVAVLVDRLEPAAPVPTDTVEVSGTVLNRAAEQFDQAAISLHLGPPVRDRAQLAALRETPVAQPLAGPLVRLGDGRLEPGASVPFSLSAPAATLLTAGSGVYPLQVTVVGRTTEGLRDLGTADTFLPHVGGDEGSGGSREPPQQVAWVLPLADRPRLAADGGLLDDGLAASISDGGRLSDVLTAATALPAATAVVDPALVRAVDITADGRHAIGGGPLRPADPEARAWLGRLSGAIAAGRLAVVPTAFADADVEALLHDGRTDLARTTVLRGRGTLREVLGTAGNGELAVPAAGRLDPIGAEFFAANGATAVLTAPGAVDGETDPPGRVRAGPSTSLSPLSPDPELHRLFRAGPTAAPTPRLAEQSVLAEFAQAQLAPGAGAPLVLAPGPDWAPSADWAAHLGALSARYPWLQPIGLDDLLTDAAARSGTGTAPASATLRYGEADRAAELDPAQLAPVADALAAVDGFTEALPVTSSATRTVSDTALTGLSAAFRTDPDGAAARVTSARQGLDALRGSVRIVASREITLTGRNGRIPVTLENDLTVPVDVTLRLTSLDRSRVQSDTSVSRLIQPGQKVQVEVAVRATSAGTFPIRLALLTPTGRPLGSPEQVLVRSTAAGVVAQGLTIAALAVLLLVVLGRGIRALLRRRRRPAVPTGPGDRDSSGTPTVAA